MSWDIEYTDEFGMWWSSLSEDEQVSLAASVQLLEERGPTLGFPHSNGINGQNTVTCENFALSTMADRYAHCMHSILDAVRFC